MAIEDGGTEPRPGVPTAPSGRVPQWVLEEAFRAQVAGTRPNFGDFTTTPAVSAPTYLGGSGDPAGFYVLPGEFEPPRRSLAVRLGGVLAGLAIGLLAVLGVQRLLNPPVPAELLGSYAARSDLPTPLSVHPPRSMPRPGFEERASPLATPPQVASPSDTWTYRDTYLEDGAEIPLLWSPCRPIHFVVNPEGAPEDFVVSATSVAQEISEATGLVLVYDGTTTEPVSEDRADYLPLLYGDRWAPVLVGWGDTGSLFAFEDDVAGVASSRSAWDRSAKRHFSVSGQVVIDPVMSTYPREYTSGVLRHEFAHLVGLGHVDDESQVMFGGSNSENRLQAGDLTGLAAVGAGPCAPGL